MCVSWGASPSGHLHRGQPFGILKGKTVRRDPPTVRTSLPALPIEIHERYRDVTLCSDIIHVTVVEGDDLDYACFYSTFS